MDIPGLREYGRGCKTLAEAEFLRDHVRGQFEVAGASTDPDERARRFPRLDPSLVQWHVVQHAHELMPDLGHRLSEDTRRVLAARGVHVDLATALVGADDASVTLSDGRRLATSTLIWTAGVAPSPLVGRLDGETSRGRLVVRPDLSVPGRPEVIALGDAAAVPDLVTGDGAVCPPTAQHATRQAPVAADNVAASLAGRPTRDYRHRDLGLVVDLGGADAVAKPFGIGLAGAPAAAVTRGYHLWALGAPTAMARVASNWALHAVQGENTVRLGFLTGSSGRLAEFEHTDDYLDPAQVRAAVAARSD